nr:TetR/AcrR family transcriptional regulator [Planobispora longispora]
MDPARSLALLWGSHTKPGRSGLTVRAIVEAALGIADAEGLDALSMRHVAERLGVGTMSLYTHVPGKGELTDLMIDAAYGELYRDVDEPSSQPDGWRGALEFVAARNWDLYRRHPWMLQIVTPARCWAPTPHSNTRPSCAPGRRRALRRRDGLRPRPGPDPRGGHGQGPGRLAQVEQATGMNEAEWWLASAPVLDKVMDASRFPVASRVGTAAGQEHQGASDPAHALAFGLARILDGVADLITRR